MQVSGLLVLFSLRQLPLSQEGEAMTGGNDLATKTDLANLKLQLICWIIGAALAQMASTWLHH
jgi:hypothetical protein